jgi:RecA-family ATPase
VNLTDLDVEELVDEVVPQPRGPEASRVRSLLLPSDFVELAKRVEAAGTASWLIEGIWPGDAYGVIGAEDKGGKTWAACDLGVSVATGSYWLNRFACPMPGSVVMFLGEGGERLTVRRVRAIMADRGGDEQDLAGALHVCHRAPRMTDRDEMRELSDILSEIQPRLVIVDPLYIAAAGAKGSDLYGMGEVLRGPQEAAQDIDAALVVVTHWNKTGAGSGAQRFTGVGPGA